MPSHSHVTLLSEADAWNLLQATDVGRLATVVAGTPDIAPINYVVDGRSLVFRTAEGAKLLALTIQPEVALEIDGWEAEGGWSVVAKGVATELIGEEVLAVESLPLRPWVPTVKLHYVRIAVREVTARRFRFGDEPDPEYSTAS